MELMLIGVGYEKVRDVAKTLDRGTGRGTPTEGLRGG
jgi:hypothetical protein